jgi:hypothetical protein
VLLASLSNAEVGLETIRLIIKEGGISAFLSLIFFAILGWQLHRQNLLIKDLATKLTSQEEAKRESDEADKDERDHNGITLYDQMSILNQVLTLLSQQEDRMIDFKKTYWKSGLSKGDLEERRTSRRSQE